MTVSAPGITSEHARQYREPVFLRHRKVDQQHVRARVRKLFFQQSHELGAARDEALARRALELALSGEAGTNSSRIIQTVGGLHPDLVVDFTLAHRDQVEALVDVSSRSRFLPGIASGSAAAPS